MLINCNICEMSAGMPGAKDRLSFFFASFEPSHLDSSLSHTDYFGTQYACRP